MRCLCIYRRGLGSGVVAAAGGTEQHSCRLTGRAQPAGREPLGGAGERRRVAAHCGRCLAAHLGPTWAPLRPRSSPPSSGGPSPAHRNATS